jgi:predicted unusual protein kinase regulating ubiquinone biosynthesis (AarF/ABC1/UbiB family)
MPDDKPGSGITRSWVGRTFETTRLAASLGKAAAKKMVRNAIDRGETDTDAPGADDADVAQAEDLVDRLGQLKGLMLKFGQMASYLDGAMPDGAQRVMRRLQSEVKPLSWSEIRPVIADDLGCAPEDAFEAISTTPFAAASIGQVHRATLRGQPVVVKVQYPGVAETLETDLGNLRRFALLGTLGTAVDSDALVTELRQRMKEECNYRLEAENQQMFLDFFGHDNRVVIPAVHLERVSRRVITSDFIDGRAFHAFADGASQADRDRAGELIFSVAFRSIFGASAFNGDPHPGNYLFLDEGRVAFLDFGCVRLFDPAQIDRWKAFATATLDGDFHRWKSVFLETGFVASKKFDFEHQWQVMRYLYEPMTVHGFQYNHAYVRRSYDMLLWNTPNQRRIAMPPEWLLVNRLQWGLNSVLAHLGSAGDFRAAFRDALALPTVVPRRPVLFADGLAATTP